MQIEQHFHQQNTESRANPPLLIKGSAETLLLHTCCAPCSAAIIEWMLQNGIRPVLFYFNPNIFPEEEYVKRKNECTRYALKQGLDIIDGDYDHSRWLDEVKGMETEPERGLRCLQCFKIRMLASAQQASEAGIRQFATTLASSRWKNIEQISQAGHWAARFYPSTVFYDKNWRKDGLNERRQILLRENGFYNQAYCGCEFSLRGKERLMTTYSDFVPIRNLPPQIPKPEET